ncbi:MAG: repeat-containing protein [Verrucomicrobiales bacterium]|nr:repeat-containing protein [Verrucomicrobiales bacterium]
MGTLLAGAFLFLRFREPHYEGKSLDQWLAELANTTLSENQKALKRSAVVNEQEYKVWLDDANTRHAHATKALRAMGTNTLPHLLTLLHAQDSRFKTELMRLSKKQSIFDFSFSLAADDIQAAVDGFHALGDLGTPAIPQLIEALNKTNYLAYDIFALIAMGEPAIPALRKLLDDKDFHMRYGVAMNLGFFEADGRCFVPLALERLQDEHKAVRQAAAQSLGRIGSDAEIVVPALIQALKDDNASVRWAAAKALIHYKPESNPIIIEAMTPLLSDPDPTVKRTIIMTLSQVERGTTNAESRR